MLITGTHPLERISVLITGTHPLERISVLITGTHPLERISVLITGTHPLEDIMRIRVPNVSHQLVKVHLHLTHDL